MAVSSGFGAFFIARDMVAMARKHWIHFGHSLGVSDSSGDVGSGENLGVGVMGLEVGGLSSSLDMSNPSSINRSLKLGRSLYLSELSGVLGIASGDLGLIECPTWDLNGDLGLIECPTWDLGGDLGLIECSRGGLIMLVLD